jgi:CheY-like chemotaxis protein
VTAESPGPGQGSTFTVRLPVAEPAGDRDDGDARGAKAPRDGRVVLVADDNQDGAVMLGDLLELLGHEVHIVHDGAEAVARAEILRPELILMDVGMPKLNGLDATRQIRARPWGGEPFIIALTGWGQESDRARSREAGCNAHLVKPISIDQLEKVFAELPPGTLGGR